jgi:hypothetical protein
MRRLLKSPPTLLVGLLISIFFSIQASADDQDIPQRKIDVAAAGGRLLTSFSFNDAFTAGVRKKLTSGLPTRIVVQIGIERKDSKKPVGFWAREVDIVYDLWEEVYLVTVNDNRSKRSARAPNVAEAIALAGQISGAELAQVSAHKPGTYRLRVLVEVNPVSKEMVENIRRWLARSPGSKSTPAGSTNFFGSFVGIFVDRRIGEADHSSTFVSQDFQWGAP